MMTKLSERFSSGDLVVCRGIIETVGYRGDGGEVRHTLKRYYSPEYDTSSEVQRLIRLCEDGEVINLENELAVAKDRIAKLEKHVGMVIGLAKLVKTTGIRNEIANVDLDEIEAIAPLLREMSQLRGRLATAMTEMEQYWLQGRQDNV